MSSAGILFTDQKSILLLRRAEGSHQDTWGLPGGHSKQNESELETAKRETQEETGLKKIPGKCLGKYANNEFTTFIFRVENQFHCKITKEHSSWGWFPLEKLKEQDLHPGLEESLPGYLDVIRRGAKNFKEWLDIRILGRKMIMGG
jgi:8-oxo-dGTP pyrophosphatase MutT (NUDIX family)